ncbi:hypothetical protein HJC23_013775 [Cyclotella cryptica]|uniref:Uncharacterized protein n=1 Tax=Cyclotella cryptica TaxID=29204 RepID=A0ABD3PGT1_9STRA
MSQLWICVLIFVGGLCNVRSFHLPSCRRPNAYRSHHEKTIAINSVGVGVPIGTNIKSSSVPYVPATNNPKQHQDNDQDTLSNFSQDVQHVLQNLRGMEFDPCIPKHLMGRPSALSYSKTWTLDDWEYHNSRKRYFRYLLKFPHSRLMRRIMPQQCALLAWTLCSVWIENHFLSSYKPQIPLASLGTISTFVAFLLTLRSNHAMSRLNEARNLWSKVILNTREMASLIASFVYPVDKQLALMLGRHVSLFGWLLKSQLRFSKKDDVAELVRVMLPNKKDSDYVLSQRQKTVAVVTRIRQVLAHLGKAHKLTTAEEIALDHTAHALSELITSTGRIRASPIPTLYTSHTSRLLIFYLFCLPPSLHLSGLDVLTTTILTMVAGFAMFGLDEISHLFEQPFRVIPMYQMSKRSMQAVADAFTCRPPSLEGEVRDDEEEMLGQRELTTYWSNQDISKVSDNLME